MQLVVVAMEKKVIYYENLKGKKHVKEFIDKLSSGAKAKILARLEFLGEHWHELRRPLVDYIGDNLYELRIQYSPYNVRIIYAYMFKDYMVLLHAINKKTLKIIKNDKLKAKKRLIDFQMRYNEGRIKLK